MRSGARHGPVTSHVDSVDLATGDGDLADLLHWLGNQVIQTRLAAVPEDTASVLWLAADEFIPVGGDSSPAATTPGRSPAPRTRALTVVVCAVPSRGLRSQASWRAKR